MSDQISDAILDEIIAQDPKCRVACETLVKTGMVINDNKMFMKPIREFVKYEQD